jgi:HEPN domain-containing protein
MAFDKEKTTLYWTESAAYDVETGKSLLEAKKFPYALFFAHLAIEKLLKAIVVEKTGEHAPYTHSLILLANKAQIDISEKMYEHLAEFMEFHIEARYPDEKKSFYDTCTEDFTRQKFSEFEEIYSWLMKELKKSSESS